MNCQNSTTCPNNVMNADGCTGITQTKFDKEYIRKNFPSAYDGYDVNFNKDSIILFRPLEMFNKKFFVLDQKNTGRNRKQSSIQFDIDDMKDLVVTPSDNDHIEIADDVGKVSMTMDEWKDIKELVLCSEHDDLPYLCLATKSPHVNLNYEAYSLRIHGKNSFLDIRTFDQRRKTGIGQCRIWQYKKILDNKKVVGVSVQYDNEWITIKNRMNNLRIKRDDLSKAVRYAETYHIIYNHEKDIEKEIIELVRGHMLPKSAIEKVCDKYVNEFLGNDDYSKEIFIIRFTNDFDLSNKLLKIIENA